ncbi:hypothetical protein Golomagni_02733 [Golovinomyces magnicellulatus]|nr:hypothetical protein Golomagni_02733 [Golovinomyces magnicellulatus]
MDTSRSSQLEPRKISGSPLSKGRENAKSIFCRNILIYGHCRFEDHGCTFNHDPNKMVNALPDTLYNINRLESKCCIFAWTQITRIELDFKGEINFRQR